MERPPVEEILADMQAVLDQGREAVARYDEFAQKHGVREGCGIAALTGPNSFPARRAVFGALIHELENLEEGISEVNRKLFPEKAPKAVGARAVGNRFRI